jgi:hypothetical protein
MISSSIIVKIVMERHFVYIIKLNITAKSVVIHDVNMVRRNIIVNYVLEKVYVFMIEIKRIVVNVKGLLCVNIIEEREPVWHAMDQVYVNIAKEGAIV